LHTYAHTHTHTHTFSLAHRLQPQANPFRCQRCCTSALKFYTSCILTHTFSQAHRLQPQANPFRCRGCCTSALNFYTAYILTHTHTHFRRLTGFSRKQTPSDAGDAANQLTSDFNASAFNSANGNISLIDTTGIFNAFRNASWNEATETLTVYASVTVPAYQVLSAPVLYGCIHVYVCCVHNILHNALWNEATETLTVYASVTVPAYQVLSVPLLYGSIHVYICCVYKYIHKMYRGMRQLSRHV
jgi:hypothetical protein